MWIMGKEERKRLLLPKKVHLDVVKFSVSSPCSTLSLSLDSPSQWRV